MPLCTLVVWTESDVALSHLPRLSGFDLVLDGEAGAGHFKDRPQKELNLCQPSMVVNGYFICKLSFWACLLTTPLTSILCLTLCS